MINIIKFIPTISGNEWTTTTTTEGGNLGIHCQRKFKDGVRMLETAIELWESPKLVHMVLTGSDLATYKLFIQRIKRRMTDEDVLFDYKGCEEMDTRKGQHVHLMWVVDTDNTDDLFNNFDRSSMAGKVLASIQKLEPDFDVYIGEPQNHGGTPYIPLSADTLQDAADWLSYIYKWRSKPQGHRYMSGRSSRHCRSDRQKTIRLANAVAASTSAIALSRQDRHRQWRGIPSIGWQSSSLARQLQPKPLALRSGPHQAMAYGLCRPCSS